VVQNPLVEEVGKGVDVPCEVEEFDAGDEVFFFPLGNEVPVRNEGFPIFGDAPALPLGNVRGGESGEGDEVERLLVHVKNYMGLPPGVK
jgi:hypothetical protein